MTTDSSAPAAPPSPKPLAGRLLAVVAVVLSALSLRTAVTSLTPLLDEVGDTLGFGTSVAAVLGTVPTLMFAAAGPLTPWLVERLGLQRTALVAMVLATLGLAGRVVGGTAGLLVFSAVALIGMGIGNVVIPPLVKYYFPDRIGSMSAFYITFLQLGTALPPLLAVPAAEHAGWRVSLAMWALLSLFAVVPWIRLIRTGGAEPHSAGPDTHHVPGRVTSSPVAWGLGLMFAMTSLNTYAMFTWLPKILTDAGHSPSYGGTMLALFSSMGIASSLLAPALAARMVNPFPVVVGAVACFVGGYLGLLLAPEHSLAILWVVLAGAGPTTFPLALTLINLRSRSPQGSAALSGFVQGFGYLVACLGPFLFGTLHSLTHGWVASFCLLGVTLVVLTTGGFIACKPRFLEDGWGTKEAR